MDLGQAVARALSGHRQVDVAERLGVSQNSISRWKTGDQRPALDQIAALEEACGRPRGFVLRLAGYVDDVVDVETAISADPELDDIGRGVVRSAYRNYLEILRNRAG